MKSGRLTGERFYIFLLEIVSNLSSFLTTLNCSLNVLIYLMKHRKLVLSLVFPHTDFQQLPVYAVTRRRRRSSWLLYRMSSSSNINNRIRLFTRNTNLEVCL